jgi:hypothetical protein
LDLRWSWTLFFPSLLILVRRGLDSLKIDLLVLAVQAMAVADTLYVSYEELEGVC